MCIRDRSGVGLGEAEGGEPVVLGLLHEMARLLLGAVQKDVAEGDEVRDEGVGVSGIHPVSYTHLDVYKRQLS